VSQASWRLFQCSRKILCRFQLREVGSRETVRTMWCSRLDAHHLVTSVRTTRTFHPDVPQCPTDKHWRRLDIRATPSRRLVNQYSTRSLFSKIDTDWEVSVFRPDDSASHPDDVHYLQAVQTTRQHVRTIYSNSNNSRIPFERGKDFSEDCPDAWSSRPDAHLIMTGYALFLKDIAKTRPDGAIFHPDGRRLTVRVRFSADLRSLEAYK
jgi:hypothetical protein